MPSPPTVPLAQLPPYAAAIQYMVAATVSPIMLTPSAYLDLFCQLVQRDQYILALHNRFGLPLPPTLFMTPTVNNQSHNLITQTAQTSAGTAPTTPPEPSDDLPWLDITPGSVDSSELTVAGLLAWVQRFAVLASLWQSLIHTVLFNCMVILHLLAIRCDLFPLCPHRDGFGLTGV